MEIKDLFAEWLATHAPAKMKHVLNLIRDTRRGNLYVDTIGERQRGHGPYAELLQRRYRLALKRFGLANRRVIHRTDLFTVPPARGQQMALF